MIAGSTGPIGLKFQLRVPEIIHPIAQFMHETLLVIGFRVAAATVAADLLEFELADLSVGQMHLEIGERRRSPEQHRGGNKEAGN